MGKHPLYTALGWVVWKVGKRQARKRLQTDEPRKRRMRCGVASVVVVGAVAAGAYLLTADDAVT